ncbi:MAG: DUF2779 domain-containing protein [Leptospiraceae bacterium]|nr:DUF2779 domain-containing protein [Leptospiraceae bacterium]
MPNYKISKSLFLRGLQCHKSLWLYKHKPEERRKPDASLQATFNAGTEVGQLAQGLFPGGVEIDFDHRNFNGMAKRTAELIEQGCNTIYEATFIRDGILVLVDILHKSRDGWQLFEVKSTASVKDYQILDTSIQWYVVSHHLPLTKAAVVHIDIDYVRKGELDLQKLFHVADITDSVLPLQSQIPAQLQQMHTVVNHEDQPDIEIGDHCLSPFECDFSDYCWRSVPQDSVFNLYRMNWNQRWELFNDGIKSIAEIPEDYTLTDTQQIQRTVLRSGEPYIDKAVITDFLEQLQYPIAYLDFETFSEPVPRFDGQRPFQNIPFQFSLHIEDRTGRITHHEFLADENSYPVHDFAEALLAKLPEQGTILAWNMGFEKGIVRSVASGVSQFQQQLENLKPRFMDLLQPFQKKGYYHPAMHGSFSIKSVLPALFPNDPELNYKSLSVQDGSMAMTIYAGLHKIADPAERQSIRDSLLVYCKLDTLAMVKILQFLRKL